MVEGAEVGAQVLALFVGDEVAGGGQDDVGQVQAFGELGGDGAVAAVQGRGHAGRDAGLGPDALAVQFEQDVAGVLAAGQGQVEILPVRQAAGDGLSEELDDAVDDLGAFQVLRLRCDVVAFQRHFAVAPGELGAWRGRPDVPERRVLAQEGVAADEDRHGVVVPVVRHAARQHGRDRVGDADFPLAAVIEERRHSVAAVAGAQGRAVPVPLGVDAVARPVAHRHGIAMIVRGLAFGCDKAIGAAGQMQENRFHRALYALSEGAGSKVKEQAGGCRSLIPGSVDNRPRERL